MSPTFPSSTLRVTWDSQSPTFTGAPADGMYPSSVPSIWVNCGTGPVAVMTSATFCPALTLVPLGA